MRRSRGLAQIFFCEYLRNLRETDNREFSVVRGIVLPPPVAPLKGGLLSLAVSGSAGETGCRVVPIHRDVSRHRWPFIIIPFSFFIFPFSFSLRGSVAGEVEWLIG